MRVVSLIASATEIVCALGFRDALVARSHECDFPHGVEDLPAVTRPKFDVHRTSAEIDRAVKDLVRDGLSVYEVDSAALEALAPDVIVTQSQCEVCAVSLRDVERAVCSWLRRCPTLVSLLPNDLKDVWADIERVGLALGAYDRAADLIARLKARMAAISERLPPQRPRVACIEWVQPLMAAGNWVPELVAMAGGVNLFGAAGKHSPWMSAEELIAARPDVTVLMPCGYGLSRTLEEVPLMPAGLSGRVVCVDGNQFFNRPGPRLVESLEILAEVLHPGAFDFGHRGTGWREVG
jgi:iron complex transport system substrate-binding protein